MSIRGTQALILVPTRELAQKIQKAVIALSDYMNIECHACVGDREDMAKLQAGVHVVVGTPGRVSHVINRRAFRTDNIKIFCLDEADEMLSRGFKDQIYEGSLFILLSLFLARYIINLNSVPTSATVYSGRLVLCHHTC